MKNLNVQIVSIISYLDPVFAIIFALAFLRQIPTIYTLIGGTLLIGSGLLTTIIALKDKDRGPDINIE
jgi:drug/metabolite transporter (DMT)-like permease